MKTIKFSAKCSDLFGASLLENGRVIGNYDGYVPDCVPGEYGDYVRMEIDIETGRILNWKKPTIKQLRETFK
jgi:hypothetical protein